MYFTKWLDSFNKPWIVLIRHCRFTVIESVGEKLCRDLNQTSIERKVFLLDKRNNNNHRELWFSKDVCRSSTTTTTTTRQL
jgi:hypothetical protein